jgi:signal peptidase II
VILLSVAIDRITKIIVMKHMTLGQSIPSGNHFISLYYTRNTGIAFSLFDDTAGARWALAGIQAVLVVIIIVIMVVILMRETRVLTSVAFALMLGGGIGNLIDRIAYGSVTDFVSVGSFPVFNFADSCLTVGCAVLIVYLLFFSQPDNRGTAGTTDEPGNPGGSSSA